MPVIDSLWVYPLLGLTGGVAGLVDSIAGGGGLITVPVLLGIGLPPPIALGTNKLQSSFGSLTASRHYLRRGVVVLRDCLNGIGWTFAGASAGTLAVQRVGTHFLETAIPVLLAVILVFSILKPELGALDRRPWWRPRPFYAVFGLGLGFYDGFFGPGTGSFWAMAFVAVLGFNLRAATGYTKVMNATSNVASLLFFLLGGKVWFAGGLTMALGQIVGARAGAHLVVTRGVRFIRPLYLAVVALTVLKLCYQTWIASP